MPIKNNFDSLLIMFKLAKELEIEPLRQLMAAAIASFFRLRCMDDIKVDLDLKMD